MRALGDTFPYILHNPLTAAACFGTRLGGSYSYMMRCSPRGGNAWKSSLPLSLVLCVRTHCTKCFIIIIILRFLYFFTFLVPQQQTKEISPYNRLSEQPSNTATHTATHSLARYSKSPFSHTHLLFCYSVYFF